MIRGRTEVATRMLVLAGGALVAWGCGEGGSVVPADALARLMNDGEVGAVSPGLSSPPPPMTVPPRFCPNDDCSATPLAFWKFEDCNTLSTQLFDSAGSSQITHPAFRAVSAACTASVDGTGIRLAGTNDIVYAPDQPDFTFDHGLTVAAWINPDGVSASQSIVRKRLDGSSSFVLAIDGGKLTFALRLTTGRAVGISAPIKARRSTHVAATYDGTQALLYVNGAVVASAKASGAIAAGVGPVFVGNDASGRELAGIVDDVWLNTVAAPASVIQQLTCIHGAPVVALTPATTPAEVAGTAVPFDLAITNTDGAACAPDIFQAVPGTGYPLQLSVPYPVTLAPGETTHLAVPVTSAKSAVAGSYGVQYVVFDESDYGAPATAQAVYVVGTGPVSCDGRPPVTPQITGSLSSPVGSPPAGLYTYAAPQLVAPAVTVLSNGDGTTSGLQVSANPGTSTDPRNAYLGFGMGFLGCLDASAFTGVQFTITGDLGTCTLQLELTPSEDNAAPWGFCTAADGQCYGPFSQPVGVGTTVVSFSDMTGGTPLATVDPSALNDIGWSLTVPTDGVTAPCVANFSVTDVSFVSAGAPAPDAGMSGPPGGHAGRTGAAL
jgi:hypothetical protein